MIEDEYRERSDRIAVHTPEILEEIVADNAIHESVYARVCFSVCLVFIASYNRHFLLGKI